MWIIAAEHKDCIQRWQLGINLATTWSPASTEENSHLSISKINLKQATTLKLEEVKWRQETQQKGTERLLK